MRSAKRKIWTVCWEDNTTQNIDQYVSGQNETLGRTRWIHASCEIHRTFLDLINHHHSRSLFSIIFCMLDKPEITMRDRNRRKAFFVLLFYSLFQNNWNNFRINKIEWLRNCINIGKPKANSSTTFHASHARKLYPTEHSPLILNSFCFRVGDGVFLPFFRERCFTAVCGITCNSNKLYATLDCMQRRAET